MLEHGLRYTAVVPGLASLFERSARAVALPEDPVELTEGRCKRTCSFSVRPYRRLVGLLRERQTAGQVVETGEIGGSDGPFAGGGCGGFARLGERLFSLCDFALFLLDGGVVLFDRSYGGPPQFVVYVRRVHDFAPHG